jgi:hypothetical protein
MRMRFLFFFFAGLMSFSAYSQLSVVKMVGKNSGNSKLGFGAFAYWDIPLNDVGNRSVMIELLDFAYFPRKNSQLNSVIGYISIKAGYRYIFSEETKTGFYIEPSLGYCRVVNSEGPDGTYGDGLAIAGEAGYTIEVGQRGNNLNFGLKYETDMAGTNHTVSSIGFRVAYSFHLFRKRDE